jgi:hypothetical protein
MDFLQDGKLGYLGRILIAEKAQSGIPIPQDSSCQLPRLRAKKNRPAMQSGLTSDVRLLS